MKISQQYSLINDLEKSLITIFEDSDYEFHINEENLWVEEVFKSNMFLPLFLFDKQKLIYRFCVEHLGKSQAQVILQQQDNTPFDFAVNIEHTMKNQEQYTLLLKFLIGLVVADPLFSQKNIDLNAKYKYWYDVLNSSLVQSAQ